MRLICVRCAVPGGPPLPVCGLVRFTIPVRFITCGVVLRCGAVRKLPVRSRRERLREQPAVSGTMARPAAGGPPGESRSGATATAPGSRTGWLTPVNAAIIICTLLALGLRLLLLSRPGYLLGVTEYDDGPYFGSSVSLIDGLLPYKEFILVQPPGITLLMLPAAALSKITGTAAAMASGRVLTTLASSAGVLLVGLLVRHRGLLTVIVACGLVAVYPDSVSTARTVLVEPWLVLFCLLGALALFDRDRLTTSGRRLFWSGVAFGFAGC